MKITIFANSLQKIPRVCRPECQLQKYLKKMGCSTKNFSGHLNLERTELLIDAGKDSDLVIMTPENYDYIKNDHRTEDTAVLEMLNVIAKLTEGEKPPKIILVTDPLSSRFQKKVLRLNIKTVESWDSKNLIRKIQQHYNTWSGDQEL